MAKLIRSHMFNTILVILVIFAPLVFLMSSRNLFTMLGALTFTVSMTVVYAYWPAVKDTFYARHKILHFEDNLAVGIIFAWLSIGVWFAVATFIRVVNEIPLFEPSAKLLAFFQYINIIGAVLHLSAKGVVKNNVPRTFWFGVFAAIISGVLLGGGLILYDMRVR